MARKLQIRRGAKADLPTLSQGEFGMVTDSGAEELFIGTALANLGIPLLAEGQLPIKCYDLRNTNADLNALFKGGAHIAVYLTDGTTLGTPHKEGKTTMQNAAIISYSSSTSMGAQLAFCSGSNLICHRRMNSGTISKWGSLYTENYTPT